MNKKYRVAIGGLSAATLALFALYKIKKILSGQSPLERTIKHIMEQPLDPETYRLMRAFESHLKSLPPDEALQQAQLYIDGKTPIGTLQPGDIIEQPYRGLRIESDGSVYLNQ